jgi:hypothetical protein
MYGRQGMHVLLLKASEGAAADVSCSKAVTATVMPDAAANAASGGPAMLVASEAQVCTLL